MSASSAIPIRVRGGPRCSAFSRSSILPASCSSSATSSASTTSSPTPPSKEEASTSRRRGGFLNIHADFTVHPHNRNWQRRANILLYLNEDWKPEYGGDLELWSADMKECVEKVSPIANRALIFTTDPTSFHGHPEPMRCPEGVARRSLALYYFSVEEDPMVRSTEYRSRPGDGAHAILDLRRYTDAARLRLGEAAPRNLRSNCQQAPCLSRPSPAEGLPKLAADSATVSPYRFARTRCAGADSKASDSSHARREPSPLNRRSAVQPHSLI